MALFDRIFTKKKPSTLTTNPHSPARVHHQTSTIAPHAVQPPHDTLSRHSAGHSSLYSSNRSQNVNSLGSTPSGIGTDSLREVKCEILANWLHTKQEEKCWSQGNAGEGVFVKKCKGNYACVPATLANDDSILYASVVEMNVRYAMTVKTRVISYLLEKSDVPYVQIRPGLRLQVIPDFASLPSCQRGQSAAFIASERILVVWQDDAKLLLERAELLINYMMRMMCGSDYAYLIDEEVDMALGKGLWHDHNEPEDIFGPGGHLEEDNDRKLKIWQAIYTSFSVLLLITAMGSGWRNVAIEQVQEPNWLRLLFMITLIPQFWLSLFFYQALVGNIAQIIGPNHQMKDNSRYYSGKPPRRLHRDTFGKQLPHVTIQMPVYKEGLKGVIEPTVRSIKTAISTYELQGGTANIFINDDGMQLISPEDAAERQEFYDENNIGWVARPRHDPNAEHSGRAFTRPGKFKKASNMNYALGLSVKVEKRLASTPRHQEWTQADENAAYRAALHDVVIASEGEAWADGSIRVGDYILLIDSDTRVPADCLLEAVSEMEQSPQVAILQYSSGVMNVTNNFFEMGITFFTNMIYTMIRFAVAGGDVAPFVGHNAILRWSAIQEVGYYCETDKYDKYWSEETVSEDFDMSLRLQSEGYYVRLGAYKGEGYKEGVSLTVYDELARWEKYAYGCNELIFHPLRHWPLRGPLTPLFRTFIFSCMPLPSKLTIVSYIGTYYAIGSAWILTILNYFLIGFFNGSLDHYYIPSFRVYFAIVSVFTGLGNMSLAVLRYRLGEKDFCGSLLENAKWIPMMAIFLGGVSLHISQALLCHFFSIDMEWGATTKELEVVSFFQAMTHVLRKFKWTFAFCVGMTGVMLTMRFALPEDWQINQLIALYPMATVVVTHFLLPTVLNPQLMTFNW